MLVGLFTSRVVLRALGAEDLGIYSAVAGVVTMFTVLTGAMSVATGRFITFELGKGGEDLRKVFATSMSIQLILSAVVVLLVETAGMWWLESRMVIPPDRLQAARWVLHLSAASLVLQLVSTPYNAEIIAHERMDAFAYISIFEGLGKLGTAFLISVSSHDKLVVYAALLVAVSLVTRLAYGLFCRRRFPEVRTMPHLDRGISGRMFSFAGWTFIGSGATILSEQGGNLLLNLFFGPVANAAWLLASQVKGAVQKLLSDLVTAMNPQIFKSYARNETDYMLHLVFTGSRVSLYLILLIICPVFFNVPFLVDLWLGKGLAPADAVIFIRLVLLHLLLSSVSYTLVTAVQATGEVRDYQLYVGGLTLLNLPISYLCLSLGAPAQCIYVVMIAISAVIFFVRLYLLDRLMDFPAGKFLRTVFCNELIVAALSMSVSWGLSRLLPQGSWPGFLAHAGISLAWTAVVIAFAGLSARERRQWMTRIFKGHETV